MNMTLAHGGYLWTDLSVALHNTNKYASLQIGDSTSLKEKYEIIKQVMEYIKYVYHNSVIYGDLKMVNLPLDQQYG